MSPDMTPDAPDNLDSMELETSPPAPVRPAAPVPPAAPAAPGRFEPLNLSRRPFLNTRPVVRVSLILWLLGLALLAGNVSLFWSYRERSADKRAQIARGEAEIDRQQAASRQLQAQLDNFDLEQENRRVDFLNHKIQQRTFSWSTLLDRVAERLPNDVRLNRLAPLTGDKTEKEFQRTRQTRRGGQGDEVPLLITGETRKEEALLSFVDSLYKAPFSYPDLTREETEEGGQLVKFELTVQYRPGPATAAVVPGTAPGAPAGPQPKIEELPAPAPAPGAAGSTAIAAPGAAATSAAPPSLSARPAPKKPPGGRP